MKVAPTSLCVWLGLLGIAVILGGCVGYAVSGYETPVYGNYGYVGPWESPSVVVEGGYFTPPPYRRVERGHREEPGARREAVTPARRPPGQRPAARPIPSIPNHPRPPRQNSGQRRR